MPSAGRMPLGPYLVNFVPFQRVPLIWFDPLWRLFGESWNLSEFGANKNLAEKKLLYFPYIQNSLGDPVEFNTTRDNVYELIKSRDMFIVQEKLCTLCKYQIRPSPWNSDSWTLERSWRQLRVCWAPHRSCEVECEVGQRIAAINISPWWLPEDASMNDPCFLIVHWRVASQLGHLCCQMLHDGSHVDWNSRTHPLSVIAPSYRLQR